MWCSCGRNLDLPGAKRLSIPNCIACINNAGYPEYNKVNVKCDIHYIGFSKIYKRRGILHGGCRSDGGWKIGPCQ